MVKVIDATPVDAASLPAPRTPHKAVDQAAWQFRCHEPWASKTLTLHARLSVGVALFTAETTCRRARVSAVAATSPPCAVSRLCLTRSKYAHTNRARLLYGMSVLWSLRVDSQRRRGSSCACRLLADLAGVLTMSWTRATRAQSGQQPGRCIDTFDHVLSSSSFPFR